MFELGEKVVCVDDQPYTRNGVPVDFPLKRGDVFKVLGFWGASEFPEGVSIDCEHIRIGLENRVLKEALIDYGHSLESYDVWPVNRFRRLPKADKSVFRGMFNRVGKPKYERTVTVSRSLILDRGIEIPLISPLSEDFVYRGTKTPLPKVEWRSL